MLFLLKNLFPSSHQLLYQNSRMIKDILKLPGPFRKENGIYMGFYSMHTNKTGIWGARQLCALFQKWLDSEIMYL